MMYMEIASKLFFGLLALLLITRILGKKEMSQLTPFDFIYSIVLGGILEESIYDEKMDYVVLSPFAHAIQSIDRAIDLLNSPAGGLLHPYLPEHPDQLNE